MNVNTATVRIAALSLSMLLLAACGGGGGGGGGAPARGFRIQTPEIEIEPGQEISYCYYFRTPNTETLAIRRWGSEMSAGTHHMMMFTTTNAQGQPVDKRSPGTLSSTNCDFSAATQIIMNWTYAAHTSSETLDLPTDDGAGKPLAMEVPANSAGFLLMRFVNPSVDDPITARVTLRADALDAGVAYTRTDTYYTFNNSLSIPPNTNGDIEAQTCNLPPDTSFWRMSTHTHKQAVSAVVKDGEPISTDVVFSSTDWEQPGAVTFDAPDFFSFVTDRLTYECTYDNPTNRTIESGHSAARDEQCVAVGYYFPATKPLICFDGLGPF